VKTNEDHNRQVDDAIDAINSALTGLGGKQSDLSENLNQVNILVNNTQVQMKEQEENLLKQSSSDLNEVKKNLQGLGERSDVAERRIAELDNGSQGLLDKLIGLETGLGSKINDETKLLSNKIEKSESQQVSLEKKMGDMDASNHQLLDKLLAVEQDLDGKLKGVHDNSNGLMDKINALDTDNRDNAQRIVSIQERLVLQTDHITKVESERAMSEVKAKKELETTVETNAKAISDLKADLDKALLGTSASMKESIEKMEKNQEEKISETNNAFAGKVRELEDVMKVTKTEMNNTATKNLHKLEILEDKINNIDDEQLKVKNQIQEVSKTIKDQSLSVDKVCSDMKTELDNSVAE